MSRPRPLSLPVLAGAALVSSPALWRALDGTGAPAVALTRFLVCLVLCWAALSAVATLVGPPPRAEPAEHHGDDAEETNRSQ